MVAHLFRFPKHTSPDLVRWTPLNSLIASIPRSRTNPSICPSTTRTSTITGQAHSRPNLILGTHGTSAVSTLTSSLHWQHTTLLTSICEHPKSTRTMHSHLLTSTFTNRQYPVFHLLEKKAGADAFSPLAFPWHSDKTCLILLHRKHHCSRTNFHSLSDPSGCTVSCHMVRPKALVTDNYVTALYSKGNFCM